MNKAQLKSRGQELMALVESSANDQALSAHEKSTRLALIEDRVTSHLAATERQLAIEHARQRFLHAGNADGRSVELSGTAARRHVVPTATMTGPSVEYLAHSGNTNPVGVVA